MGTDTTVTVAGVATAVSYLVTAAAEQFTSVQLGDGVQGAMVVLFTVIITYLVPKIGPSQKVNEPPRGRPHV